MRFGFFRGQKVTIMGIGLAGRAPGIARFFVKRGALVTATDLRSRRALEATIKKLPAGVRIIVGRHRPEDFRRADWVIKNPAVPRDSRFLGIAGSGGVPILTDVGIFFLGLPRGVRVVGITGTKGKSTTAYMIAAALSRRFPVKLAGVPGTSYLEMLEGLRPGTVVVAELSSFDLEGLYSVGRSPDVAVITNIARDHLNRYGTMAAYIRAKSAIFAFQDRRGIVVANKNDPLVRKMAGAAPGRIKFFPAAGDHMMANIAAAKRVAEVFGLDPARTERFLLGSFRQLPGHFEIVARKSAVTVINDTSATNPLATKMALRKTFELYPGRTTVAILGGADKRLDFSQLLPEIRGVSAAVLLPGDASPKIRAVLSRANVGEVARAKTLRGALRKADRLCRRAGKRGAVLFSPAAASFNMFKNEFERGAEFNKAVKYLYP